MDLVDGDLVPVCLNVRFEVLKMTALYAARVGENWLQELRSRESGNFQFEFLRANHSFFAFFRALVDQYKMLIEEEQTVEAQEEQVLWLEQGGGGGQNFGSLMKLVHELGYSARQDPVVRHHSQPSRVTQSPQYVAVEHVWPWAKLERSNRGSNASRTLILVVLFHLFVCSVMEKNIK